MLKKGKKKKLPFYKKLFMRILAGGVNRVDFVRLIERIANTRTGQGHLEQYQTLPTDWENTAEISALAAELTMNQLAREGREADPSEIRDLISEIEIQYSRELHINGAAALKTIFNQVFEHTSEDLPFVSANQRDLKHLDTLKAYREQGLGVLYLINHNSHLDEFIFNVLMQDMGMGLPVFAAGQNMMAVKSIAKVLMIGSYVVLRKGASRHQMAALYNYCSALSRKGAQQGIFLEAWRGGARTRDGSLRYPKRLVAVRGAIDTDKDLVIQPVALSYSVVPEDLMMCSRKSAKTWFRGLGSLKTALSAFIHPRSFLWRGAKDLYSRAYISFPRPMLLSELEARHREDKRGIELDEFIALQAITQIAKKKKIMATHVVARGLAFAEKNQAPNLKKSVKQEMDKIKKYHRQAFGENPDFEDFIRKNPAEEIIRDGVTTLKKRGILSKWAKDGAGHPAVLDDIGLSYYATHGDRRLYSPTADQNIVVVGTGNWAFALASHVAHRILDNKAYANASLTIYDPRKPLVRQMGKERQGPDKFSNQRLPRNVFVTHDLASAFRKASEVIIALRPEDFEAQLRQILDVSEQHLKIMVATRGFIPETTFLPFHLVQNLMVEYNRTDIEVLTLAGPIDPEDIVEGQEVTGTLAGSPAVLDELAGLFLPPGGSRVLSTDPIGVQAADILARVYAFCVNVLSNADGDKKGAMMGQLVARASAEARALTLAMGASPDTFNADSLPWTATFITLAMEGPLKEMGEKLGLAVKKGKDPVKVFKKHLDQMDKDNSKPRILPDMEAALNCGVQRDVNLPVLSQVYDLIQGVARGEVRHETKDI